MKRLTIACLLLLTAAPLTAADYVMPEIRTSVVLDFIDIEDDGLTTETTFHPATDRFFVREASLELTGCHDDLVDYVVKGGTAACQGNTQFQLLEAGVMVRLGANARVGFEKSHVLRGFINYEECIDQLAAEKPNFASVLSPCHPTGFKADWRGEAERWRWFAQLALLNGSSDSLEDEHDYNLGLHLEPPVPGLTLSGYVNDVEFLTGEWDDDFNALSADGSRWGVGARWEDRGLHLQAERIEARGFPTSIIGPADAGNDDHYADHHMLCAYAEAGLSLDVGGDRISAVVPYLRYQYWDRDTDAESDEVCEYLTVGTILKLADEYADIRLEYENPIHTADSEGAEAARFIARFQFLL